MNKNNDENEDGIAPETMRRFLQDEINNSAKAHELRAKELSEIMKACGKDMSVDEASERYNKYLDRWHEALPGAAMYPGAIDDEILAKIDATRAEQRRTYSARLANEFPNGRGR